MKKPLISIVLFTLSASLPLAAAPISSCGNCNNSGTTGRNGSVPWGDPVIPYTGNEFRDVNDLQVWGGVGNHQLLWSRHASSRALGNADFFGQGHYWRHNYQWDLVSAGTDKQKRKLLSLTEPIGNTWIFTQTGTSEWTSQRGCPGKLIVQGSDLVYQNAEGYRYRFSPLASGKTVSWVLADFRDDAGNTYRLDYNASRQLLKVREPAGRFLQLSYTTVDQTRGSMVTLAKLSTAPQPGQWIDFPVNTSSAYRYVRVLGADGSYGNIAEVQFLDTNGKVLTGSTISSDPLTAPAAFDGKANTGFVSAAESGAYVGLDLGSPKKIGRVRVLATAGKESLMVNRNFQASSLRVQGLNSAPASLTVIDHVTTSDGRSVKYRYTAFNDQVLPLSYPTLTEVGYGDGTKASYIYGQIFAGTRPLITEYNDVRCTTRQQHSQTVYQSGQYAVLGMVDHQVNPETGGVILSLGNRNGNLHQPTVTFANGGTVIQGMNLGLMAWQTDANGQTTAYSYDTNGFLKSVRDPLGRTTGYARNPFGGVLSQTNADSSVESFTRNDLNSVTTHTDTLGRVTTWTRDDSNRVTGIKYPDGSAESFTYNGFGEILVHILRNGSRESFNYDSRGLLQSRVDPLGNTTTYSYDSADRLNSVTDANGNTTTMAYTERGLVSQMVNPDGSSREMAYDARGNLLEESNELGAIWSYDYDPTFSLLLSKTDPLERTTRFTYLPNSPEARPSQVILPSSKGMANTYDLAWHLLSTTVGEGSPDAATTRYVYDGAYNLIKTIDGNGKVWSYGYDSRNRRISATDPLGQVTTYAYDAASNLIKTTRPDGKAATRAYDAMNRLVSSTDESGNTTRYAYDASGNLASLTDAKGNVYSYGYDALHRCLSMTYPDKSRELWSYDKAGNMIGYTTRAGQKATYSYDNRNRCTGYSWSDGTPSVARTYDEAGRLLSLSNSASVSDFEYDAANQLLSETQTITGKLPRKVGYSYDADGNRATLSYPGVWRVSYQYNDRNLLKRVASGVDDTVATFSYDRNGYRTGKTLANGVQTTYLYDAASRLTGVTNSAGTSASIVAGYSYSLDKLGRRTARTETTSLASRKDSYSYDPISQITNVAYASGTKVAYAYDAVGNRTSVATTSGKTNTVIPYLANNCNQYTKVGSLLVSSDKNGNLTSDQNGTTYSYDAQNRLVRVTTKGSNPTVVTMAYDARNRVVSRTVNGSQTTYVYDGWSLINELDSYGIEDAHYIHGPAIDEILRRNATLGGPAYYTQDGNGNVTTLTSSSGAVQERYTYDVYGTPTITSSTGVTLRSSAVGNRYLFTGREYIAEIGLYDYRNRVYSPGLGRFLQTDPIGFEAADVNIYRYCGNEPTGWIDPWGLDNLNYTGDNFVARLPNDKENYTVSAHGDKDHLYYVDKDGKKQQLDIDEITKKILADPNYDPKKPVKLNACSTGKGDDNVAQRMADKLNNDVIAPTDDLTREPVYPQGLILLKGINIHEDKNGNTLPVGEKSSIDNGGTWKTHHPKRKSP